MGYADADEVTPKILPLGKVTNADTVAEMKLHAISVRFFFALAVIVYPVGLWIGPRLSPADISVAAKVVVIALLCSALCVCLLRLLLRRSNQAYWMGWTVGARQLDVVVSGSLQQLTKIRKGMQQKRRFSSTFVPIAANGTSIGYAALVLVITPVLRVVLNFDPATVLIAHLSIVALLVIQGISYTRVYQLRGAELWVLDMHWLRVTEKWIVPLADLKISCNCRDRLVCIAGPACQLDINAGLLCRPNSFVRSLVSQVRV